MPCFGDLGWDIVSRTVRMVPIEMTEIFQCYRFSVGISFEIQA